MVGIITRSRNSVTFPITLPICGMMTDQIEALKKAREEQAKAGNLDGAQSLHMIITMAEAGLNMFNVSTVAPQIIFTSASSEELPMRS